jgi:hypothetical protein
MALIIDLSAARRRILRLRALRRAGRVDSPLERYKRADLNWQLNPTSGTATERVTALLAMLAAREKTS